MTRHALATTIALASSLLFGMACLDDDPMAPGTAAPLDSELQVVWTGPSTYYVELDSSVGTTYTNPPTGLTLTYVGQAEYGNEPVRSSYWDAADSLEGAGESGCPTLTDKLLGMRIEDQWGREFEVTAVDLPQVQAGIASYDASMAAAGISETPTPCGSSPVSTDIDFKDYPTSWVLRAPAIDTGVLIHDEVFYWDDIPNGDPGDERVSVPGTSYSVEAKRTLTYYNGVVGSTAGACSAFLVGNSVAVTSAHCVKNEDGTWVGGAGSLSGRGRVCTLGNGSPSWNTATNAPGADTVTDSNVICSTVQGRIDDDWKKGKSSRDWAILILNQPLGATVGTFFMSQASDSMITSFDARNVGYPAFFTDPATWPFACNQGGCPASGTALGGAGPAGARAPVSSPGFEHFGSDVAGVSRNFVKTRVDIRRGHSGGPLIQDRSCSGCFVVVGVQSIHRSGASNWNGGPKMPRIREQIIPFIP